MINIILILKSTTEQLFLITIQIVHLKLLGTKSNVSIKSLSNQFVHFYIFKFQFIVHISISSNVHSYL